jgi:hypothetical protein
MSILDDINKHGYAIRTSLEYIDPRVVKCLFRIAKNNKIRYVDTKRWITHDIKFKSKYMKSFHRNYRKSTSDIKIYKNFALLYSEDNCPRQDIHRDREFDDEEINGRKAIPLTSILAVMDDTRIMVRRKEIVLKAGEMIFFKPTTLHCGLFYEKENVRLIQWTDIL